MLELMWPALVFLVLSVCPLVLAGYFVSSRRMGFFVDAVAHSTLALFSVLVLVFSAWMSIGPDLSIWFAVLGIGGIGACVSFRLFGHGRSQEPWMGEIFVGSLAIAAIVFSQFPLGGIDFDALFVGQILLIKPIDFHILLLLNAGFLIAYGVYGRRWHLFFVDRSLYRHFFGPTRWPVFVLFFLMTSLIGFLVQSIGIIYCFALLVFPVRWASRFGARLVSVFWVSAVSIVWVGFLGLVLSYWLDVPAGPMGALLWVVVELICWGVPARLLGRLG